MANYGFGVYNAFPQVRSNYSYSNIYKKLTDISLPKANNSYMNGIGIFGFAPAIPTLIPFTAVNNTKKTTIPSLNKNTYAVNENKNKENVNNKAVSKQEKPVIPSLSDLIQLDETTEALKDALNNPNLTPEEKAIIQSRLDAVEIKEEETKPKEPIIPSLSDLIQLDETTEALKDALNNPNLTPEERAIIQSRLDAVEIKEEETKPKEPIIPSLSDLIQLDETTEALKDALNNPNLTPEEKAIIQSRLDAVEIKEENTAPRVTVNPTLGNAINPFSGYEQEKKLLNQMNEGKSDNEPSVSGIALKPGIFSTFNI